jgi:hypothetical protein
MKYVSVTSVDVEQQFSRYKAILKSNRRNLKFENLKLYVVSNCFSHEEYLDDSDVTVHHRYPAHVAQ